MSDKFGEGRDPYLYPGLDIMRNRLNIRQQQRLEQAAYEMTALRAATIELGPLVRGLPHLRTIHRQPLDELRFLQANQITFFLQILHQGIALFFDISKVAERRITLININFTQLPCPVENILIQLAMDSSQMR
jgi:hypothetical protein